MVQMRSSLSVDRSHQTKFSRSLSLRDAHDAIGLFHSSRLRRRERQVSTLKGKDDCISDPRA